MCRLARPKIRAHDLVEIPRARDRKDCLVKVGFALGFDHGNRVSVAQGAGDDRFEAGIVRQVQREAKPLLAGR